VTPSILDMLRDVFPQFMQPSWSAWRAFLCAVFGLAPENEEAASLIRRCTGRSAAIVAAAREIWLIAGRRAGKSFIVALLAIYLSLFREYRLSPGEVGTLIILAADKKQARVIKRYVAGLLRSAPLLKDEIVCETAESIELRNGLVIEIFAASFRSTRGYTAIGVIAEELAFWRNEDSANPDTEIIAALKPSLATTGGLLIALSSPYARRGELYKNFRRHFGAKDGDPVLVWKADTRTMNPEVPQSIIDEAYEEDASRAAAEYGAEFRSDVETFISREALDACVVPGRTEVPRVAGVSYRAFLDFAGGSGGDSATLAIAHVEKRDGVVVCVIDAIRERKPPFSPDSVCEEFAALIKNYGIARAISDKWGGLFPIEGMKKRGVRVEPSAKAKSDLYRELLPLINSGRCELPDDKKLIAQLAGLERRTARGGKDSIDHPPGAHDDLANAVAGVLTLDGGPTPRVRRFDLTPEEESILAARFAARSR
jgi:hypothetical protein